MSKKDLNERTIQTREIFSGRVIRLEQRQVRLPNGHETSREVVIHPGAVAIIAEPRPGEILCVHQYRNAPGQVLLEVPAGKLNPGELAEDCARRELAEETGYVAKSVHQVYEFFTSPGFATEKIVLFYASEMESGSVNLDEDEFVETVLLNRETVQGLLRDGSVKDAKTIIAFQWWLQRGETP